MTIEEQKEAIIVAVGQVEEEDAWILKAICKLLDIDDDHFVISEAHKRILDERLAEHEANPENVISWEELKEELKR